MDLTPIIPPYLTAVQGLQKTIDDKRYYFILTFGDAQKFKCSTCGQCCMQSWNIGVDDDYVKTWQPVFQSHPSGRFKSPFKELETPSKYHRFILQRQPNSLRCIFLEEDNKCFIHRNYGEEALPYVCRTYPRDQVILNDMNIAHQALLSSCNTAPQTMMGRHTLYYFQSLPAPHLKIRPIEDVDISNRFFEPYPGMLFFSMLLDSLDTGDGSFLTHCKGLLPALEWFTDRPLKSYSAQDVLRRANEHLNWKKTAFIGPSHTKEKALALEWFLGLLNPQSPMFQRVQTLLKNLPFERWEFTRPEQDLLNEYLKTYFRRHLLRIYFEMDIMKHSHYFHQLFRCSLLMLHIQLWAYIMRTQDKRPLDIHLLRDATNLMEIHYGHQHSFNQQQAITSFSPRMCLENMKIAFSVDLTQTPLIY